MRTTLSLDKDVAAAIERLRKTRKISLKHVIDEALRRGLGQMASPAAATRRPFRTRAVSLGRCLVGNVDNVSEVLAVAEGKSSK
jgi:hypothetical protein